MEFIRDRHLLSCVRRAVEEYDMIEDGDRIAVGLSGGKDSTALLCALIELRRFLPRKFELEAITVDMGFEGMDFAPVKEFCEKAEVAFTIDKTNISQIVFDYRGEANPCALCAKMRRGALHKTAVERGCNKVALGHHFDDAVVTFMMNLMNEGRIGCFSPVTYLSDRNITLIRPLIYADEGDIKYFVRGNNLPIVVSTCPEDKHTDRERVKVLLSELEKQDKGLRHRLFTAMRKAEVDGWKKP